MCRTHRRCPSSSNNARTRAINTAAKRVERARRALSAANTAGDTEQIAAAEKRVQDALTKQAATHDAYPLPPRENQGHDTTNTDTSSANSRDTSNDAVRSTPNITGVVIGNGVGNFGVIDKDVTVNVVLTPTTAQPSVTVTRQHSRGHDTTPTDNTTATENTAHTKRNKSAPTARSDQPKPKANTKAKGRHADDAPRDTTSAAWQRLAEAHASGDRERIAAVERETYEQYLTEDRARREAKTTVHNTTLITNGTGNIGLNRGTVNINGVPQNRGHDTTRDRNLYGTGITGDIHISGDGSVWIDGKRVR